MIAVSDPDRVEALAKWARRVVKEGAFNGPEARTAPRHPFHAQIVLLPLQATTMTPLLERKTAAAAKDRSPRGLGLVSDTELEEVFYFAQVLGTEKEQEVLLVRKVRERRVRGSIHEYGFMILDRYDSFRELHDNPV